MSLKNIITKGLATLTTLTAISSAPAYALEVIPGPGAQKEAAEQADSKGTMYATHNQNLLWIEQDGERTYMRANITAPEFLANGTGVGNLIAALWDSPNINVVNESDAKKNIISANLNGLKFSSPQYQQLQSCLTQQMVRNEVKNADPTKTAQIDTYQTHNLLIANITAGSDQESSKVAQVSCELDGYFVEALQARTSAFGNNSHNDVDKNPESNLFELFESSKTASLDSIISSESSSLELSSSTLTSIAKAPVLESAYMSLRKGLRNEDGSLKDYHAISKDQIQDTYNLLKQVTNGDLQLSKQETEQLAIDAYNVLDDQTSEYFISVKDIKKELGVNLDLRAKTLALGANGRQEKQVQRKLDFQSQLADLYQDHLQISNGSLESYTSWKKQMRKIGASRNDLQQIVANHSPVPAYLS